MDTRGRNQRFIGNVDLLPPGTELMSPRGVPKSGPAMGTGQIITIRAVLTREMKTWPGCLCNKSSCLLIRQLITGPFINVAGQKAWHSLKSRRLFLSKSDSTAPFDHHFTPHAVSSALRIKSFRVGRLHNGKLKIYMIFENSSNRQKGPCIKMLIHNYYAVIFLNGD